MLQYEYSKWDGTQKPSSSVTDQLFDNFSEYLMEYGEPVMSLLDQLQEQDPELLQTLLKEGYLEKGDQTPFRVSPKGIRRIQDKALAGLFSINRKDSPGKHNTLFRGAGETLHDESKPYEYGDPVANLNLHETLKNAIARQGKGTPIDISEQDFVVHDTEFQTQCATVLLLDMSGSMTRYSKFYHAKKVALALQNWVRDRFREDFFQVIGFYTYASPLSERELIYCAPKEVSLFDSRVRLRINLAEMDDWIPEHFTNIDVGLKFARRTLARQPAQNKQIIIVTDGEPTAHVEGDELVLLYPPSERTARHTLADAKKCAQQGIHISSLALVEDYFYLELVNFVEQLAQVTKGVAAYCTAGKLGKYVFDCFTDGRRTRRTVG